MNLPYFTAFDFVFKDENLSLGCPRSGKREKFLGYPKHLKLTLFIDDPKIEKIRKMEFMQRYMVIDEIKELGNEAYFNSDYLKAIGTYNKAYACLKWLEFKDDHDIEEASTEDKSQTLEASMKKVRDLTSEMSEELRSKIKVDLESLTEKSFYLQRGMKEKKKKEDPKLKKLMTVFDDDNTSLRLDDSLTCEHDIQMRSRF